MEKNSKYWEKRIASETWGIYNSLEEKNRELLEFYIEASESVKDELYRLAEKYSKDGVLSLSEMHKQNRLTELNKKYEKIIEDLGRTIESTSEKNMQQGFRDTYKNVAISMENVDFAMPNKKLMEKLLNAPWRGDTFSKRLWKNQKKLAVSLNNVLLTGLQQGKTVTEIAIQLHNRMGQGFNECHRLIRTETMHYLNDATLQRYKDADIRFVQVWAALDERTCETCGSYHGKIYPIEKCPVVPFHANCRCTILPVVDEKIIAKYEKKYEQLAGVMKLSIPDEVYESSGMSLKIKDAINEAIRKLEKEYVVYIDGIEGAHMGKRDIFGSGGYIDDAGVLRHSLLFNYDINYEKVEHRMEKLYNEKVMAGRTFEDYIAHEIAHIIPFQDCITKEDYLQVRKELKSTFVHGISGYADRTQDGAESLAEAFVRYRNGEEIPDEARKLIKKYLLPWRRS